jgi:hypothetical protein
MQRMGCFFKSPPRAACYLSRLNSICFLADIFIAFGVWISLFFLLDPLVDKCGLPCRAVNLIPSGRNFSPASRHNPFAKPSPCFLLLG